MQLLAGFVALVAVVQSVMALPSPSAESSLARRAPVPVTKLVCDGNTYKCTANLKFGDDRWVAQWDTAVFHTTPAGAVEHKPTSEMAMAPVPVTAVNCDGDTYKCTANLQFGDGNWVAQWSTAVFHQDFSGHEVSRRAPVPARNLVCDGDTYKCTANLDFGDGNWVAQWGTAVFHS